MGSTINKYCEIPRPTKGGHFSAYLICPLRAWYEYYGSKSIKAKDPAYLTALYAEGNKYEKAVYQAEEHADSVTIPSRMPDKERLELTSKEILQKRHKYIFQAYFKGSDRIGIADMLELDNEGHYRIGDIKASKEVNIAYALQIMWYNELLEEVQGCSCKDGFIILGNGLKVNIDFSICRHIYEDAKNKLFSLREVKPDERSFDLTPFLTRNCYSCPWRKECMKELKESADVSLIDGISRRKALILKENGITSWKSLIGKSQYELSILGLDDNEIKAIKDALPVLQNRHFLLREKLSPSTLSDLIPACFDAIYPNRTSTRHFYYMWGKEIQKIGLRQSNGSYCLELPKEVSLARFALYGSDYVEFKNLIEHNSNRLKAYDIFNIIEDYVHAPFHDVDLASVDQFVREETFSGKDLSLFASSSKLESVKRLEALKNVMDFIKLSAEHSLGRND